MQRGRYALALLLSLKHTLATATANRCCCWTIKVAIRMRINYLTETDSLDSFGSSQSCSACWPADIVCRELSSVSSECGAASAVNEGSACVCLVLNNTQTEKQDFIFCWMKWMFFVRGKEYKPLINIINNSIYSIPSINIRTYFFPENFIDLSL